MWGAFLLFLRTLYVRVWCCDANDDDIMMTLQVGWTDCTCGHCQMGLRHPNFSRSPLLVRTRRLIAPRPDAHHRATCLVIALRNIQSGWATGRIALGAVQRQSHRLRFGRRSTATTTTTSTATTVAEQLAQIQLRNIVEHGQTQHHSDQTDDQIDGGEHFVQRSVRLDGVVAGYEVAQTDGGQRNEAVVEGVQRRPVGLQPGEHQRRQG